jgi:hypothetical protein
VATYYDIFGQKVQYLSSDPSDVQKGQVWYNSTSNTAKCKVLLQLDLLQQEELTL